MQQVPRRNRFTLGALLLLAPLIARADPAAWDPSVPERITWRKAPVELALTVGKERRVDFPGPVKVGVPATLRAVLRVQSVAGSVYLLARQPFEPARMMVRAMEGGDTYLLVRHRNPRPMDVVMNDWLSLS
jgi:hypothetical protein